MAYQVLLEYDSETKSHTATVPGLPIVVDARSERQALRLVKESLAWYLEEVRGARSARRIPRPVRAKLVMVTV